MIAWHTAEGWLDPALRSGAGWRLLRTAGGMAAPLFVLLAGAALSLQVQSGRPHVVRGLVARGLGIVVLGYALRLQAWTLDSVGILQPWSWCVWLPAGIGLAVALVGCRRLARLGARDALPWVAGGALLFFGGVYQLGWVAPGRLAGALRVDILQCIGASMVIVASVGAATGALRRGMRALALAALVMLTTPFVWSIIPDGTPGWIGGYLGPTTATPAPFALLPWCAYAFVGSAFGTVWHRAALDGRLTRVVVGLAVLGVVVAIATSESLPHAYRWTRDAPWLVQPFRVAFRTGLSLVLASSMLAVAERARALRDLGKASLLVYWVHLSFAFGIASRPVHHRLGWEGWLVGCVALCAAMYVLARLRLGPFETWRLRSIERRPLSVKRALL